MSKLFYGALLFITTMFLTYCSSNDSSPLSNTSSSSSSISSSDSLDSNDVSDILDTNMVDTTGKDSATDSSSNSSSSAISNYPEYMVDDFEDGNGGAMQGGGWYTFSDAGNGGLSRIHVTTDENGIVADGEGYNGSLHSFYANYYLDKGDYQWAPYVSIGVTLNKSESFDASKYAGFQYYYKGSGHSIRVEMNAVKDYCYHVTKKASSTTWKKAVVKFSDLMQESWGKQIDFDPSDIRALAWTFSGSTGDSGEIYIDSIRFLDSIPTVIENNMVIHDAEVPELSQIEDFSQLTNPLQEKAMKYLNKGINLTNWLEAGKFDGSFAYDKAKITQFANDGFKSIRFPIDLDLYIVNRDEVLAGTAEFKIDSLIFEPLDSLVNWTRELGLSLTIDYHQYDGSLSKTSVVDPIYKETVSKCWKAVAQRYVSNNREDIFYELTNEPGIGDNIPQADWDALAQQMLDSIRVVDTYHSVLFGETRWYDISNLIKFTPFKDDNVIYVFHSYDPFIFTHQGASWAGMSTTKNLMFPYDKDLWNTEYSYFGFNSDMDSWILNSLETYYKTGNKNAIKNSMILAKNWAVKNNVPVVCNEFGAYNAKTEPKYIINYLTTVREIFEELEIPWQIWFGAYSDNGELYPGADTALGLK